jgi:hypothetical protein
LKVLVDETRPLDFTAQADPADWTNNNQPVISFKTTDQFSGVDHYELAIDNGSFTRVSSPYKLPTLTDGEHKITVKAVDKMGWETIAATKVYIDTTAPVIGEFKAVPGDKKIIVRWQTTATDVKSYVLKRLPAFKHGSKKELGPDVLEYVDTEVENSRKYRYSIQAFDHIDNASPVVDASMVRPGIVEAKTEPTVETKIEYENVVIGVPVKALPQEKTLTIMEVKDPEPILEKSLAVNISKVYEFERN